MHSTLIFIFFAELSNPYHCVGDHAVTSQYVSTVQYQVPLSCQLFPAIVVIHVLSTRHFPILRLEHTPFGKMWQTSHAAFLLFFDCCQHRRKINSAFFAVFHALQVIASSSHFLYRLSPDASLLPQWSNDCAASWAVSKVTAPPDAFVV